jgi:DHA2 family multidrug resistance protein
MTPHPPLRGGQLVLGTLALSMSTFMTVLDSSIANVSIPAISGDIGVSPEQGTWIITSFGVANAISVPLTGFLTQRFGQVRLMIAIVLLFVAASWLCGLAPNIESLIAARVVQGLVSGPIIPLSQTLLLGSYPFAQAGTALAMWSITVLVAPVVGPLLGGWITDNLSWPWIFYINVPIGLLTAVVLWSIYREREVPPRLVRIDFVGLALLVMWVGALQMVVDLGKEMDWFASGLIVLLAVVAVVFLLLFLAWELTEDHPVVDLRLFGERNFLVGGLAISIGYGLFFGNVVLLPLWLQQHMGYTPSWAGMALAPVGVFAILMSPWVGRNVARVDPRWLTSVALVAFATTFWLRARFTVDADIWTVMIPTLVQGIGMAFFFIPLQAMMFAGLRPERMPAATGLSNFVRITAGAVGVSIFTTAWENRAAMHHARLAESVNADNPAYRQVTETLGGVGLGADQQLAMINRLIDQQAYTLAATDIFHLSSVLFLLLGALVWSTRRRTGAPMPTRAPTPAPASSSTPTSASITASAPASTSTSAPTSTRSGA